MAYQLWHEVLACGLQIAEAREKLTSDELEGLGYKLLAVLVSVLVVRHDCDCVSYVFGVGGAAMAGGRRS